MEILEKRCELCPKLTHFFSIPIAAFEHVLVCREIRLLKYCAIKLLKISLEIFEN